MLPSVKMLFSSCSIPLGTAFRSLINCERVAPRSMFLLTICTTNAAHENTPELLHEILELNSR